MRKTVVGITTAALALTYGAIAPTAQAAPTQPVAPPTPTVLKTLSVDVSGDGKADTVTITALGGSQYELKVVTAKTTSAVIYTSDADTSDSDATEAQLVWKGAATLDGVKGSELIVSTHVGGFADSFAVYTWRKGALVAETAPPTPSHTGWRLPALHNFRFFTLHHRAYVETTKFSGTGKATVIRSKWSNGKWVKQSTRHVKYAGWRAAYETDLYAPSILVSQAQVDLDGDGRLDKVSYRLLATKARTKIVTATGKVISRTLPVSEDYAGAPLIATIDGAPGAEVAYTDADHWLVLTLRKGKLVSVPSPEGNHWATEQAEEGGASYDFAEVNGQWQVSARAYDYLTTMYWTRYLWVSGTWLQDSTWTTSVTPDEAAAMCHGFCGVAITQL
jgi:hypothetical protein